MSVGGAGGADLAASIRTSLRAAADPVRAPGQQAYMKSAMPFLGVTVPDARRIARAACNGVTDAAVLRAAALALWDHAEYREERYAGMAVLAVRPASDDLDVLPVIEHMVRTGQWWDFTDELAHRVADLHDRFPIETATVVRTWSTDDDRWIRRIAILSQLGRRDRVDAELLSEVVEPNVSDPEFFVRKAIGWALREYARVDPDWVVAFADSHELSPLSRREALKHL
ncbi:DNA alkylation repair protein [uncultured Microbacterium sp.]|uniref:DNA alkylation repair protein n=1 Tax=uncultured Microbacterium sp. TaxID=191216 RepID=UPI0035CB61AF